MFLSLDGDSSAEASPGGSLVAMVELARHGDARGFTALFQYFNGPICTYLVRLVGNDELGRDLAQETFLRAWQSLPDLRGELHFKAWLYRIATNVARSHLRHERIIQWLPWTESDQHFAGPEERAGEVECVQQALRRLTPQCRTCLLLQLVAGFSQREIAALLAISEKSVSAYVSRGREQFR
ncbi:MAG TPA: RNA polymerase sigma factor, partial [Ktedonobacteraceae bacterium]|nr:RNA polymerase sigma factor [Ktedonobacteraceae bacterium]